jgi:predicted PurR-regulated permease PerM
MGDFFGKPENRELTRKATEVSVRLFLVAALAYWCFLIFEPFLLPLVWGVVIAVALGRPFKRLEAWLGGRRGLAVMLFVVVGIGAVVLPTYLLSGSFLEGVVWLEAQEDGGTLQVPPPPARVADWPFIGDDVHELWAHASNEPEAVMRQFSPQLRGFGSWLFSTLGSFGIAVLLTLVAIVIAVVVLKYSEGAVRVAHAIGARLGGAQGEAAVDLAAETIRSVAGGVVGVAVIQSVLAGAGLYLADVPAAGLLAALVLILAVAQLPPVLILGPAILYVLATSDSLLTQVLFTIWSVLVSVSDAVLKPLLLGRGMKIPMPVILIGAIGGLIRSGFIGLFVGCVVLAVGYQIFTAWMGQDDAPASADEPSGQPRPGS